MKKLERRSRREKLLQSWRDMREAAAKGGRKELGRVGCIDTFQGKLDNDLKGRK